MFLPQYLHRSTLNVWHRSFIVRHLFSSLSGSLVRISSAHLLFIMAKISFAKINPVNGKSTFVDVSTWNDRERVGGRDRQRNWYENFQVSSEKVIISVPIYLHSSILLQCFAAFSLECLFLIMSFILLHTSPHKHIRIRNLQTNEIITLAKNIAERMKKKQNAHRNIQKFF